MACSPFSHKTMLHPAMKSHACLDMNGMTIQLLLLHMLLCDVQICTWSFGVICDKHWQSLGTGCHGYSQTVIPRVLEMGLKIGCQTLIRICCIR